MKILNEVIKTYGSEHKFNEEEGGLIIDIQTTTYHFQKYIKGIELSKLISTTLIY